MVKTEGPGIPDLAQQVTEGQPCVGTSGLQCSVLQLGKSLPLFPSLASAVRVFPGAVFLFMAGVWPQRSSRALADLVRPITFPTNTLCCPWPLDPSITLGSWFGCLRFPSEGD